MATQESTLRRKPIVCLACGRSFWRKRHGSHDSMLACSRECGWTVMRINAAKRRMVRESDMRACWVAFLCIYPILAKLVALARNEKKAAKLLYWRA